MINQLTVFMQNTEGRLSKMCRVLADNNINMHTLYIADTADFGVVRIFADTPRAARKVLTGAGFTVTVIPVVGVKVPNRTGGLAELLELLDEKHINIEYSYCFSVNHDYAIFVIKADEDDVEPLLEAHGFELVKIEELYQRD